MEKPSAGSGILSRSRAKTAPNGGQPHSEDDSSEEEHSHGEPGGLGLKARWSGEVSWKVEEVGEELRTTDGFCRSWIATSAFSCLVLPAQEIYRLGP